MGESSAEQLLADASSQKGDSAPLKHMQAVSIGPLAMPVPDDCSDQYAAGWAAGDSHVRGGGNLLADAAPSWSDEKANGFWDRLREERSKAQGE